MKKQVVVIHGGDNYGTYEAYIASLKEFVVDSLEYFMKQGWKDSLESSLGDEYKVIRPEMPNKFNARYEEWRIWFEKLLPLLDQEIILVGHSLGGIFLAKYLSENKLAKRIHGTFLIAAPFDEEDADYELVDFNLPPSLKLLEEQGGKIFLYHSKDDKQVPFKDIAKYAKAIPNAVVRTFKDKGHFNQKEFPELVSDIKSL
ncbi:alpha/beta hydrolase [Candidatus Parcubacteria bacterium]|nr:alpha/beta hydrolase [Candidatus Parcubacteria bacterium]